LMPREESMSTRQVPRWLFVAALLTARATHAQTGRITGQAIDSTSARPLASVEVSVRAEDDRVLSTARTDASGRYVLANVAPGNVRLRARILGYAAKDVLVAVRAGESATADFALTMRSIQLDQVVVTGTAGA